MVYIVGPDGMPLDIKNLPVILSGEACLNLMRQQADVLVEATTGSEEVVIVPALEAALIPLGWMMVYISYRYPPNVAAKFEIASMKPRGGGLQHERRDLLGSLHHDVTGKDVILFDPCIDSGGTLRKLMLHHEFNRCSSLRVCALVVKSRFVQPGTPQSIGNPLDYPGFDYLVGGTFGLDLDKKFRGHRDLVTVPPGSKAIVSISKPGNVHSLAS